MVKGSHHTKETIAKMRGSQKGHFVSEETRMKLSKSLKGRIFSEETKAKIGKNPKCGFQKGNTANPKSEISHIGERFGKLTIISEQRKNGHRTMALCLCDCGNYKSIIASRVSNGYTKSCGCLSTTDRDPEWGRNIGKAQTGHIRMCGSNNSNWKGGIGIEPYCDAWADKEYKADIKERDNSICMNPDCWNTSETLCLHHIDYDKKNCSPLNLITLCASCNARANFSRENHTFYYQDLMTEFYGYEYGEQQLSLLEAVNQ